MRSWKALKRLLASSVESIGRASISIVVALEPRFASVVDPVISQTVK
jgi:hypothetical protein